MNHHADQRLVVKVETLPKQEDKHVSRSEEMVATKSEPDVLTMAVEEALIENVAADETGVADKAHRSEYDEDVKPETVMTKAVHEPP
jgi:hypothetical protein